MEYFFFTWSGTLRTRIGKADEDRGYQDCLRPCAVNRTEHFLQVVESIGAIPVLVWPDWPLDSAHSKRAALDAPSDGRQLAPVPNPEKTACTPRALVPAAFNPNAVLPYGLTTKHVGKAMGDFLSFIGFVNTQLNSRGTLRIESMLMPANFSSMVGEFMGANIPKYCRTVVKNTYHNGHPDLIPAGKFPGNAVQHSKQGIEIKGSRYLRGWQGHNPEDCWLMVFMFDSNRPVDPSKGIAPKPFQFVLVVGARLTEDDWLFAGRREGSRRTITASVTTSGYDKMMANWIYRAPGASAEDLGLEE